MTDTERVIRPADRYVGCDDLWTITCVFNPSGYRTKMENYHRFARKFHEAGLPLLTVECAFFDTPFVLEPAPDVIFVRSNSILWQKERLLNIALGQLPPQAKKVLWIDGDLLFVNPDWAVQTSRLLETFPVVQPFQQWYTLAEEELAFYGEGNTGESFAYKNQRDPDAAQTTQHGFPGYAWAARREILETHGFYDACIIGAGDHMMAHAMSNTTKTICAERVLGLLPERALIRRLLHPFETPSRKFAEHYERWAAAIYADIQNNIGSVAGQVLHLWHGTHENRRYHKRHKQLGRFHFDPETDLWKNADGAWEWSPQRSDMRCWAEHYFQQRKEDG
jgi:hypothetical protein